MEHPLYSQCNTMACGRSLLPSHYLQHVQFYILFTSTQVILMKNLAPKTQKNYSALL